MLLPYDGVALSIKAAILVTIEMSVTWRKRESESMCEEEMTVRSEEV